MNLRDANQKGMHLNHIDNFLFFFVFFPLTDDEMVYLYFNQSCTVKLLFVVSVNGPPFHSEGACIERASDPRRPSFKDLGWYKNYGDS